MFGDIKVPCEILLKIFSYLDEKDLRKSASLVCKTWFNLIRQDRKLSGTLTIFKENLVLEELQVFLNNWPKLKTLRYAGKSTDFFIQNGIEAFPSLDRIILVETRKNWKFLRVDLTAKKFCLMKNENESFPLDLTLDLNRSIGNVLTTIPDIFYERFRFIRSLLIWGRDEKNPTREHFEILSQVLSKASHLENLMCDYEVDFVLQNVISSNLEEIIVDKDRGKVDYDFLLQFLRFPKLNHLALSNVLALQIPLQLCMRNLRKLTLDCCGFQDFKLIPTAFPKIRELKIFFGRFYKNLRKHCQGFKDMMSCIELLHDLKLFRWDVNVLDDKSMENRDTQIWVNTFEENGHRVLKTLKRLQRSCFVTIELKSYFGVEEITKPIQSFVKGIGKKPFWIRHRFNDFEHWTDCEDEDVKFDTTVVCTGGKKNGGCGCDEGYTFEVSDYSESEEEGPLD